MGSMTEKKKRESGRGESASAPRLPDVRDAVVNSLIRTENGSKFSNLELDAALSKYAFDRKDKALFTALYYGVIERRITLDTVIAELSTRPSAEIEPRTLAILRMALYQIMYMDRIPDHAAVSSAVALTRKGGTDAFVNAVLRSYLRDPGKFTAESYAARHKGLSECELLSYKYSLPAPMLEGFIRDYGSARAGEIAAYACSRPPVTLRINTLMTDRERVMRSLSENGVETEVSERCPTALKLLSPHPTEMLTAVKNGQAFVQDEASQLCCEALDPHPGDFMIDSCACPGGKSFSSAMMMENRGRILSLDLRASKLSLVTEGASKLGIGIIETAVKDGREPMPEYLAKADRVLCDVPCSGLGVLAKKPDIRYKPKEDAERLPEVQYAILKNNAEYVKVGGVLVYSTCTLRKAENDEVAERFLASDSRFLPEDFSVGGADSENGRMTFFPDGVRDGFFVARFRRVAEDDK